MALYLPSYGKVQTEETLLDSARAILDGSAFLTWQIVATSDEAKARSLSAVLVFYPFFLRAQQILAMSI